MLRTLQNVSFWHIPAQGRRSVYVSSEGQSGPKLEGFGRPLMTHRRHSANCYSITSSARASAKAGPKVAMLLWNLVAGRCSSVTIPAARLPGLITTLMEGVQAQEGSMGPIGSLTAEVDGFKVFYREAGQADAPKLLLLHGFPSAGHMFRDLIPLLADRFHIVAPDLPGFGQSDMPPREEFSY